MTVEEILRTRLAALETENERLRSKLGHLLAGLCSEAAPAPDGVSFTPAERRIWNLLVLRPLVTREAAQAAIRTRGRGGRAEPSKVADVMILRMRRKLAQHQVRIVTSYGEGWRLESRAPFAPSRAELSEGARA